jgi:hypothetical protein
LRSKRDTATRQATKQFFVLILTDGRHARTITLSDWRRGPRNIFFLEGDGRQAALAVGAPAATMVVLLLVSKITVPISAISILIPTVAIIPVTISVSVSVSSVAVAVPLAITVSSVTITVTAAAATGTAGAISAWWR